MAKVTWVWQIDLDARLKENDLFRLYLIPKASFFISLSDYFMIQGGGASSGVVRSSL